MQKPLIALILAGGRGSRLGGADKAFVVLDGRPLVAHVLGRLASQCNDIIISANGDAARFAAFSARVVADDVSGFAGPLAGLVAGLDFIARQKPEITHVVSIPVDTPFAPPDLSERLIDGRRNAKIDIALARSGDRVHPTIGLWPVALRHDMRKALAEGQHGVLRFASHYRWVPVDWPVEPRDPFFNINAPDDLVRARALLATSEYGR